MITKLQAWWRRRQSLRWRLPFSYATIALLAVLALGVTLLGTLRSFYREEERAYLAGNAAAIAAEIAPLLAAGDLTAVQTQIAGYAFLIQTQVQVLGVASETVLADSGAPDALTPAIAVDSGGGLLDNLGVVEENVTIIVEEQEELLDGSLSRQQVITRTSLLPARPSLYGFTLGVDPQAARERSDLVMETAIVTSDGETAGWLRLSQGPAIGADILRSVARSWVIAGAVAVLLAALAGWRVSRRLTQPLLDLTAVTRRMAAGDLDSRARVDRQDEVGALGVAFNAMAGQVQTTVTTLRHFVADAAHELNTPLTALRTDLNLLAEAAGDSVAGERVKRAQAQAKRLQNLTTSLLDLSRLEAAGEMAVTESVDLRALLETRSEAYASRAEQSGLDFEVVLGATAVPVVVPPAHLALALDNVLDNSLKFTPPPGHIALRLEVEADTAVVTVGDTGIGIPEEDRGQLFGRFHRGRNTGDIPGSGLGLAIVHTIVTAAGGKVIVTSDAEGTIVNLVLPLAKEAGS